MDRDPSLSRTYSSDGFFALGLAAGAPVNAKQQEGWTPLHGAVHNKDVAMVRLLLAHGADPKQQNDAGKSAIGLAAETGDVELLKLLKA